MSLRDPLLVGLAAAALTLSACGGESSRGGGERGGAGQLPGAAGHHGRGPASAAGRSGSGAGAGWPAGPADRTTFIRNADRVCRRAHARIAGLGNQLRDAVLAADRKRMPLAAYYARASKLTRMSADVATQAVAELKALPRPRDERVETYLTLSGTQARLLAGEADALRRGDGRTLRRLDARVRQLGSRSRTLAHGYGFRECGGG